MYKFNAPKIKDEIVQWIRSWFETNGKGCNAIVGISGGKDSSVVAALCVEALGKDRVIGVLMPNLAQPDIDYSFMLCEALDIQHFMVPVTAAVADVLNAVEGAGIVPNEQATVNLPARIRMATLYAVSQSMNGRVANTCNLSEDWVGYATRFGDGGTGDFCPLANLTVQEVKAVGRECNLPQELIEKVPSDGLCGKTDEDNLGFTYADLDTYIRTGSYKSQITRNKIDRKHRDNLFKMKMPPSYDPGIPTIDQGGAI